MSAMEIDFEGIPQQTQPQTVFQWVSYVAVPFLGKVLKCIDGKPVELLNDFPQQNPPQQPKPELKIKTPSYDEKDFWASTPSSAYSDYTGVSGY
jgi:hypothetical protein